MYHPSRLTWLVDTECVGYHGPIVLIQYKRTGDDDVTLYAPWFEPIDKTLAVLEDMCQGIVIGFNLTFDWFHIIKFYNTLWLLKQAVGGDAIPYNHIDTYALCEPAARNGDCLKPWSALDLMLHARKGRFQSTMDRKDIRIRRVPTVLSKPLQLELNRRIKFDDIYFARKKKDKHERWQIEAAKCPQTGKVDPQFMDVVLRFAPSTALKVLMRHIDAQTTSQEDEDIFLFGDVMPASRPMEAGWAPFALALSTPDVGWECRVGGKHGHAWPALLDEHAMHWAHDDRARTYARNDVVYLEKLLEFFGDPDHGDDDSILSCAVGAVRWRGFAVNTNKLKKLEDACTAKIAEAPRAPGRVYSDLVSLMTPIQVEAFDEHGSTKKVVLEEISKWPCLACDGKGCDECDNVGLGLPAQYATKVLDSRKAYTKRVLFRKLLQAQRLHPSASVIGSLSSRMSGRTETSDGGKAAGLNALGIQHDFEIRSAFDLAFGDLILCGGDFSAFEISIADADYDDSDLREQLLTCYNCKNVWTLQQFSTDTYCSKCRAASDKCKKCKKSLLVWEPGVTPPRSEDRNGSVLVGTYWAKCSCGCPTPKGGPEDTLRKIHGLFAQELYPGKSYDDIIATKGTAKDLYNDGKRGVFSQLYGGDENTLVDRLGIDIEEARRASNSFATRFQGVGRAKSRNYDAFCSMRQPKGIGGVVIWKDPENHAESLLGFKRDFSLENTVCETLYNLANSPPKQWSRIRDRVVRRDRTQYACNAVRSAVFGAAFQIQAKNMRAAINHRIQSTGAGLTKSLQRRLWDLQPHGVGPWKIQPFNVHDEIMTPMAEDLIEESERIVNDFVVEHRPLVPLLKIDWGSRLTSWAEK